MIQLALPKGRTPAPAFVTTAVAAAVGADFGSRGEAGR
jgi:hypothetical protein